MHRNEPDIVHHFDHEGICQCLCTLGGQEDKKKAAAQNFVTLHYVLKNYLEFQFTSAGGTGEAKIPKKTEVQRTKTNILRNTPFQDS